MTCLFVACWVIAAVVAVSGVAWWLEKNGYYEP